MKLTAANRMDGARHQPLQDDFRIDSTATSDDSVGYDKESGSYWHRVSSGPQKSRMPNFEWAQELSRWLK